MEDAAAMIAFRHPTHRWAGMRLDRTGFWWVLTIGFWTWDFVPTVVHKKLAKTVSALRKKDD